MRSWHEAIASSLGWLACVLANWLLLTSFALDAPLPVYLHQLRLLHSPGRNKMDKPLQGLMEVDSQRGCLVITTSSISLTGLLLPLLASASESLLYFIIIPTQMSCLQFLFHSTCVSVTSTVMLIEPTFRCQHPIYQTFYLLPHMPSTSAICRRYVYIHILFSPQLAAIIPFLSLFYTFYSCTRASNLLTSFSYSYLTLFFSPLHLDPIISLSRSPFSDSWNPSSESSSFPEKNNYPPHPTGIM